MYKTFSMTRIILFLLVLMLSTGAALHFLSNEGRSSMKSSISTGEVVAGKPLIDDIVPGKLETATFAMG
jgi:hypothetical protein